MEQVAVEAEVACLKRQVQVAEVVVREIGFVDNWLQEGLAPARICVSHKCHTLEL
jgi:hypothetical protein